jgi:hypothetical protein
VSEKGVAELRKVKERLESGPLKLMPEYGIDLPLWGRSLDSLDLSPYLLERLAQWQEDFEANFDPFSGWKSTESRDRWSREAERLEVELRAALPAGDELVVDLWPLTQ